MQVGLLLCAVAFVIGVAMALIEYQRRRKWRGQIDGRRQTQARENAQREAAIGPNQYRCTGCSKVYDKGRTDAEAMAEALKVFGDVLNANGPPCILCSDCYHAIMGEEPPRLDSAGGQCSLGATTHVLMARTPGGCPGCKL